MFRVPPPPLSRAVSQSAISGIEQGLRYLLSRLDMACQVSIGSRNEPYFTIVLYVPAVKESNGAFVEDSENLGKAG